MGGSAAFSTRACRRRPYTVDIFHTKVQLVCDHVLTANGDNGENAYDPRHDY